MRPIAVILVALTLVLATTTADEPVKPLVSMHGQHSKIKEPRLVRIMNDRDWQALWNEHQFGKAGLETRNYVRMDLDFARVMVIAAFDGEGVFLGGFDVDSIVESKDRLRVRIRPLHFQVVTLPKEEDIVGSQGWGVFVLPRSDKQIVMERGERQDVRRDFRWKKWTTFPAIDR